MLSLMKAQHPNLALVLASQCRHYGSFVFIVSYFLDLYVFQETLGSSDTISFHVMLGIILFKYRQSPCFHIKRMGALGGLQKTSPNHIKYCYLILSSINDTSTFSRCDHFSSSLILCDPTSILISRFLHHLSCGSQRLTFTPI